MVRGLGSTGPGGCGLARQGRFRAASAPALGSSWATLGCWLPRPAARKTRRRPSTSDSRALRTASVAPRSPHNPAREATGRQQGRRSPQLVRPQPPSYVQPRGSCARSNPPGRNAPHPVRDIPATSPGRAPAALPRPNKHKTRNSNSEPRRLSDG